MAQHTNSVLLPVRLGVNIFENYVKKTTHFEANSFISVDLQVNYFLIPNINKTETIHGVGYNL